MKEKQFIIPASCDAKRLDRVLVIGYPDLSLRARRALWETMDIHVQGKSRPPAFKVRPGQQVEVLYRRDSGPVRNNEGRLEKVVIVEQTSMFAALSKPGNVHSVRGKAHISIEDHLPALFPQEHPFLLNRLDFLTSGLVLVGFQLEALDWYVGWQDEGLVVKRYFALVHGRLDDEILVARAIDSAKRRKVHVLAAESRDPVRHTLVTPLAHEGDTTLVRAEIRKGQRHQIRAHLASLGHPIVGDPLYGPGMENSVQNQMMYLHHYEITMPDFSAVCLPDWERDVRSFCSPQPSLPFHES
ncbi:MAG: RNA pseudouridine synthase [Desulfoplanes sp.]